MNVPYEHATTGRAAREEMIQLLRGMGCESVGFMDSFETGSVILAFVHRKKKVQLEANAQGWANMYMKAKPWTRKMRRTEHEYREQAREQGQIAVNSVLRDWLKGQITAVETGVMRFEDVFLPYMMTKDGRSVAQVIEQRGVELLALDNPR